MRQQFLLSLLFALLGTVSAQFNFFEQMFGGQGGGGGGGHHHHQQQQQNAPSDSSWYRSQVDRGIPSQTSIHSERKLTTIPLQPTARTTSAQTRSPACTSHTTAPAHGPATRTSSSWRTASASAFQREGSRPGRLLGRSSWRGRGCCKRVCLTMPQGIEEHSICCSSGDTRSWSTVGRSS